MGETWSVLSPKNFATHEKAKPLLLPEEHLLRTIEIRKLIKSPQGNYMGDKVRWIWKSERCSGTLWKTNFVLVLGSVFVS